MALDGTGRMREIEVKTPGVRPTPGAFGFKSRKQGPLGLAHLVRLIHLAVD